MKVKISTVQAGDLIERHDLSSPCVVIKLDKLDTTPELFRLTSVRLCGKIRITYHNKSSMVKKL